MTASAFEYSKINTNTIACGHNNMHNYISASGYSTGRYQQHGYSDRMYYQHGYSIGMYYQHGYNIDMYYQHGYNIDMSQH